MIGSKPPEMDRQGWLGLMARAPQGQLTAACVAAGLDADGLIADGQWLRRAEVGSVMVRGRAGGTGAPFNLGEMTVTRATVQLSGGQVGHGYVQGRDKTAAEWAARVDALMQTDRAPPVRAAVLDPLRASMARTRATRAAKAAATQVAFFTLVRGED